MADPVPVPESLPVEEALAPALREADGVPLIEALRLTVLEAVAEAVPDPVAVPLEEGVPLGDWLGVSLLDQEEEAELEALAPEVKEAVMLADNVLLAL